MYLFTSSKGQLKPIQESAFALEKDMQTLTELNIESVFGIQFIATEFALQSFRIDTVAYDVENQSFVIIEYKRGTSRSVIDQGYSYLSLMLNNKAEFVQLLSIKLKKVLTNKDINREASKVLFVANSFNQYQQESINFKEVPIELWEMKKFGDVFIYNQVKAKNASTSIKTIEKGNKEKSIVDKEIVRYDEGYHTAGKSEKIIELYHKLKESILELADCEIVYNKMYIAFRKNKKNIVSIHLFVNSLNVRLYGKYASITDKFGLIRDVTGVGNYGSAQNEIKMNSDENFLKVLDLIQQTLKNAN